jgi:hypothetical protein
MGKPMAAEVPMAWCMVMLHQVMKGTERVPPPMPTRLETAPMTLPTANMPHAARHLRLGLGFFPEQHLVGHEIEKHHEKDLEKLGGKTGGEAGSQEGAHQNTQDDAPDHHPVHRPAPVVGPKAGNRGET